MDKVKVENLKEKKSKQPEGGAKALAAQRQDKKGETPRVEERPVKLREILSDYWMRRRDRLDPDFLKELKETARREPVTADSYGSYKTGIFTYGSFVVMVSQDNGWWRLEILTAEPGAKIPENVVENIRYKFIPDDAWMCKAYAPREAQRQLEGVLLMEIPFNKEQESEEE